MSERDDINKPDDEPVNSVPESPKAGASHPETFHVIDPDLIDDDPWVPNFHPKGDSSPETTVDDPGACIPGDFESSMDEAEPSKPPKAQRAHRHRSDRQRGLPPELEAALKRGDLPHLLHLTEPASTSTSDSAATEPATSSDSGSSATSSSEASVDETGADQAPRRHKRKRMPREMIESMRRGELPPVLRQLVEQSFNPDELAPSEPAPPPAPLPVPVRPSRVASPLYARRTHLAEEEPEEVAVSEKTDDADAVRKKFILMVAAFVVLIASVGIQVWRWDAGQAEIYANEADRFAEILPLQEINQVPGGWIGVPTPDWPGQTDSAVALKACRDILEKVTLGPTDTVVLIGPAGPLARCR